MSILDLFDSIGVTNQTDIQSDFDDFYALALRLFEYFYSSKTITVSSRDPCYVTPAIGLKAKLRRKKQAHEGWQG